MSWIGTATKSTLAVAVLLLGAGCGGREKVAIAHKDETIRRQQELLEKERAEKESVYKANEDLARQNNELATRHADAMQRNAAEVAQVRAQMSDLETIMKGMGDQIAKMKPGQVALDEGQSGAWKKEADGSIRIFVASTVLFDSGKADLKTSAHPTLAKICSQIKSSFPNNYLRIEGHTDATPVVRNKDKFRDNMELSIARSRAVYDFMRQNGGIAAGKMYTAGYGEFQPVVHPEKTASDRAKNRRVEIVILPNNVKVEKSPLASRK